MIWHKTASLLIVFTFVLIVFDSFVGLFPWYRMHSIKIVRPSMNTVYVPGQTMKVVIIRESFIAFEAQLTRELIKVNENSDELIWATHERYGVSQGLRTSTLYLKLPTLKAAPNMTENSYLWKGTMVYRPLGMPEKTLVFKTEKFYIGIPKSDDHG